MNPIHIWQMSLQISCVTQAKHISCMKYINHVSIMLKMKKITNVLKADLTNMWNNLGDIRSNALSPSDAHTRQLTRQSFVLVMACHLFSAKPLSEQMLIVRWTQRNIFQSYWKSEFLIQLNVLKLAQQNDALCVGLNMLSGLQPVMLWVKSAEWNAINQRASSADTGPWEWPVNNWDCDWIRL